LGREHYIPRIQLRRLIAVHEEERLVLGFSIFVRRWAVRSVRIRSLPGLQSQPTEVGPFDNHAKELLKIRCGKIYKVEALGMILPFGASIGWE
jgi:hypothetical protein